MSSRAPLCGRAVRLPPWPSGLRRQAVLARPAAACPRGRRRAWCPGRRRTRPWGSGRSSCARRKNARVWTSLVGLVMTYQGIGAFARRRGGEDLLGEDLEQRLVLDGRDLEAALGPVEAQPRALPAGDDEGRDLAVGDQLLAALAGLGAQLGLLAGRLGRDDLRRDDLAGGLKLGLVQDVLLNVLVDPVPVDGRQLLQQGRLLRLGQLVVEPQQCCWPCASTVSRMVFRSAIAHSDLA